MKAYKRNIKNEKPFHLKRRRTKKIDNVIGNGEKLLNKKKKRGEYLKDAEESYKTYSDTNETTQIKKIIKKQKKTRNLDIQKK